MASSETGKKLKRKVNFAYLHKLFCAVSLLSFLVIIAAGLRADARIITIVWRSLVVMLVVSFVNRFVVRILASYEEIMDSGEA